MPTLPPIGSPVLSSSASNNNNISKVLVLTKNDLERISSHLNKKQREEEEIFEELRRKKELHEKSQALTRGWNNTIQVRLAKCKITQKDTYFIV